MKEYALTVTLSEGVELVDVQSERLDIDLFFTPNLALVKKEELLEYVPNPAIVDFYATNLRQAYIKLVDSLEGYGFETLFLSVRVPSDLAEFCVFYRVHCPGLFPIRKLYVDRVAVQTGEESAATTGFEVVEASTEWKVRVRDRAGGS